MFKNTFQSGFLSILYSIGSKPLQIWDKKVSGRAGRSVGGTGPLALAAPVRVGLLSLCFPVGRMGAECPPPSWKRDEKACTCSPVPGTVLLCRRRAFVPDAFRSHPLAPSVSLNADRLTFGTCRKPSVTWSLYCSSPTGFLH